LNVLIALFTGDGPLGAFTYTVIDSLRNHLDGHTLESYGGILALVNESIESLGEDATEDEKLAERERLEVYSLEKINIARTYFRNHFIRTNLNRESRAGDNDLGHLHMIFEAFALSDPGHIRRKFEESEDMDILISYIRSRLRHLVDNHRINEVMYTDLMGCIGPYVAVAREFSYGPMKFHEKLVAFIRFWRSHKDSLPKWVAFVKIALLHHPNSCGSERLFSLLKRVLTTEREECLDDYICAAVYSSYRQRRDEERLNEEL